MVVKMMRWRPWPPYFSKKFEIKLVVRRLLGLDLICQGETEDGSDSVEKGKQKLVVEIRWKGQKVGLSTFKRTLKRNFTREAEGNGVLVEWDEEFQSVCALSFYKDNVFLPWEISFVVFNGVKIGGKNKIPIVGITSLNLAEFASHPEQKEFELSLPIVMPSAASDSSPILLLSLSLMEMRSTPEQSESVPRSILPISSPASPGDSLVTEKDDVSAIKAGLRKVKIFTEFVSSRKNDKNSREEGSSEVRLSTRSDFGDYAYPFDSDSTDDVEDGESNVAKESTSRKSFSYGSLASANCAGGCGEDDDMIYYSNRKSDVGCSQPDEYSASTSDSASQNSKRGILSWKKRKLSFKSSPKFRGEPLLKKAYAEEGGDDIDFDRRQLTPDRSLLEWLKNEEDSSANGSISEFGDDNFAVGRWEKKEVISRDGLMKLTSQVFYASIDQRSEKAAGESACTVLVAVIADWFQKNPNLMPIKSQLDSLIREGSKEWRSLCENENYKEQFPDGHFDLETVLQSKIRPLSVVSGKSFVGFFHPDGVEEGRFDFLHSAMSFDNIWDEINGGDLTGNPHVYIVSWNDHFFVLKAETDAFYIVDTLGERLHEGCNQAHILKFDRETVIHSIPEGSGASEDAVSAGSGSETSSQELTKSSEVVFQGKESCKEYIKSFLAGIPIRELQADVKKGLVSSTQIHQRLQIEFHYTLNVEAAQDSDVDSMVSS